MPRSRFENGLFPDSMSPDDLAPFRRLSETLHIARIVSVLFENGIFTGNVDIEFLTTPGTRKKVPFTFEYVNGGSVNDLVSDGSDPNGALDGGIPEEGAVVLIGFIPGDSVTGQDQPIILKYIAPPWDTRLQEVGGFGGLITKDGIDVAGVAEKVKLQRGEKVVIRRVGESEFSYWIMRRDGDLLVKMVKDIVHECIREIITAAEKVEVNSPKVEINAEDDASIDSPDVRLGTKDKGDLPVGTAVVLKDFITKMFLPHQNLGNLGIPTGPVIDQFIKPGTFADGTRAKP